MTKSVPYSNFGKMLLAKYMFNCGDIKILSTFESRYEHFSNLQFRVLFFKHMVLAMPPTTDLTYFSCSKRRVIGAC